MRLDGIVLALAVLAFSVGASAETLEALFDRISPSVVKIRCPDRDQAATGFVFGSASQVVTSLHVVDGSNNIQVHYPSAGVTRRATFSRVLMDADLALLTVTNPPPVEPLRYSARIPGLEEEIHALGFALNVASINHFSFQLRYGRRRLADNITSGVATELSKNGYPSLNLEVLKLGRESLLPGLSGAPLFDRSGNVVGIGDGGLEDGAINISWGIPATHLDALLTSDVREGPGSAAVKNLFGAELRADVDMSKTIYGDGVELIRVRTRRFSELVATADDQLSLAQLSSAVGFDQDNFVYDIYQDARSGATIVVPEGASISRHGRDWLVHFPESEFDRALGQRRFELLLRVAPVRSLLEAQQSSIDFENQFLSIDPGAQWQVDSDWSYAQPQQRWDGVTVNRKGAASFNMGNYGPEALRYLFATLAFRKDTFLGYAIVNHDNTPGTSALEADCVQNSQQPYCPVLFASRRDWARGLLGVMLSGFSL